MITQIDQMARSVCGHQGIARTLKQQSRTINAATNRVLTGEGSGSPKIAPFEIARVNEFLAVRD